MDELLTNLDAEMKRPAPKDNKEGRRRARAKKRISTNLLKEFVLSNYPDAYNLSIRVATEFVDDDNPWKIQCLQYLLHQGVQSYSLEAMRKVADNYMEDTEVQTQSLPADALDSTPFVGLYNPQYACYNNSITQMFYSILPLRRLLTAVAVDGKTWDQHPSLLIWYMKELKEAADANKRSVTKDDLKDLQEKFLRWGFSCYVQNDAHEWMMASFFRRIEATHYLDGKDFKATSKDHPGTHIALPDGQYVPVPASSIQAREFFAFSAVSFLKCPPDDEKASITTSQEVTLTANITADTLQKCVNNNFKIEAVPYRDPADCIDAKSNRYISRMKLYRAYNFAPFLIVHLARFTAQLRKINTEVKVDDYLKINNTYFKLEGFVYQSGTLNTGHYTYFKRAPGNNKWYKADDMKSITTSGKILQKTPVDKAYLYLFRKLPGRPDNFVDTPLPEALFPRIKINLEEDRKFEYAALPKHVAILHPGATTLTSRAFNAQKGWKTVPLLKDAKFGADGALAKVDEYMPALLEQLWTRIKLGFFPSVLVTGSRGCFNALGHIWNRWAIPAVCANAGYAINPENISPLKANIAFMVTPADAEKVEYPSTAEEVMDKIKGRMEEFTVWILTVPNAPHQFSNNQINLRSLVNILQGELPSTQTFRGVTTLQKDGKVVPIDVAPAKQPSKEPDLPDPLLPPPRKRPRRKRPPRKRPPRKRPIPRKHRPPRKIRGIAYTPSHCRLDKRRACGTYARTKNAYTRPELEEIARNCGLKRVSKFSMQDLCILIANRMPEHSDLADYFESRGFLGQPLWQEKFNILVIQLRDLARGNLDTWPLIHDSVSALLPLPREFVFAHATDEASYYLTRENLSRLLQDTEDTRARMTQVVDLFNTRDLRQSLTTVAIDDFLEWSRCQALTRVGAYEFFLRRNLPAGWSQSCPKMMKHLREYLIPFCTEYRNACFLFPEEPDSPAGSPPGSPAPGPADSPPDSPAPSPDGLSFDSPASPQSPPKGQQLSVQQVLEAVKKAEEQPEEARGMSMMQFLQQRRDQAQLQKQKEDVVKEVMEALKAGRQQKVEEDEAEAEEDEEDEAEAEEDEEDEDEETKQIQEQLREKLTVLIAQLEEQKKAEDEQKKAEDEKAYRAMMLKAVIDAREMLRQEAEAEKKKAEAEEKAEAESFAEGAWVWAD
uniref:USP domain-containing protein n=1 Tax=viral metagenome TaxID=1070528 RepID=A0A6C0BRP8_9ZZZZ